MSAPDWLLTMRAINGMSETPGAADNPKIMAMADEIGRIFGEMQSYCDQYRSDSIPWCGLTVAYTMAKANIRPPFGSTDTDRFLWARSWADDPSYQILKTPRLGCVVVLTRSGGGHVTLYESTSGSNYMCRGGNQSDAINLAAFPKSQCPCSRLAANRAVYQNPSSRRPTRFLFCARATLARLWSSCRSCCRSGSTAISAKLPTSSSESFNGSIRHWRSTGW